MPAAFSETERARITERLLANGERLFTTQGLRKTSLEDLVGDAGIAKSSFYQFFAAKEALYLELMMRQSADVKREVVDEALLSTGDVREGLRRFLHATLRRLETDPLYRRLMTHPEEMAAVMRRLGTADPGAVSAFTASPDNPARALVDFISHHQEDGELPDHDPAVIVGVIQAVLVLPLNQELLGDPALLPKIQDLLIDIVAAGLTPRKE
ncbi:TetR family transcriptional regulator [Nocardiopsis sp. Huas11]|uniref:TetR/AcrR family transcriptional regulator n=1 Tax=Nocardiopsis sp. Huas11 TaxID=2183912 RepID=UPI000EB4759D|nr:TetR/AcrR family transcriptional regulator [Nocardiopsis sp. Huas11]RKS07221.1 TetR family transcriptional regulator [Nocardiopsis sp. Huas11]